jgi:hypothetical protein
MISLINEARAAKVRSLIMVLVLVVLLVLVLVLVS